MADKIKKYTMKRILLLAFSVLLFTASWGQNDNQFNKAVALQLVKENKEAIGFSDSDIFNTVVSSSYTVSGTGMTMVYLQQTYLGIPVLNKMKVLAFMQGKLVSNAGTLVQEMEKATAGYSPAPSISTNDAVRLAFAEQKLPPPAITTAAVSQNGRLINYGKPAGISEDITAELMWFPVEEDGQVSVKLGWQVQVATFGNDDVWHVRIDALNGKLIEKVNIIIYEKSNSDHKHENKGKFETIAGFKPHIGNWVNSNKGIRERPQGPNAIANANYLVIPYPIEAPSFGAAALRSNPWTAAPGNPRRSAPAICRASRLGLALRCRAAPCPGRRG